MTRTFSEITAGIRMFDVNHLPVEEHIAICPGECCKPGDTNMRPADEWEPMAFVSPHPFPTAQEAEQHFLTEFRKFIEDKKPTKIAWRVRPETLHTTDYDTFEEKYMTYARFFYHL